VNPIVLDVEGDSKSFIYKRKVICPLLRVATQLKKESDGKGPILLSEILYLNLPVNSSWSDLRKATALPLWECV
jgi:hypothetical protein